MTACTLGNWMNWCAFYQLTCLFLGQRGHAVMCLFPGWCALGRPPSTIFVAHLCCKQLGALLSNSFWLDTSAWNGISKLQVRQGDQLWYLPNSWVASLAWTYEWAIQPVLNCNSLHCCLLYRDICAACFWADVLWSYLWARRWAWVFWALPTQASGSLGGHGQMSCCIASAWVALLSIAKISCFMKVLGFHCCLLYRDVCAACFWADVLWSYLWVRRWAWVFWWLPARASGSLGGHGQMSCCIASAWVALLSIAKISCFMKVLGLHCCLLYRDVCAACFWADVLWFYLRVRRWAWVFWTLPTQASGSLGDHGQMSCCIASAWVALLSIAKISCFMKVLGLHCCLLYCTQTYVLHASGRTSCGSTFGSVGERGSFGPYLRKPPAPWVAMGRCLVALLVLGWHCCPLQKSIASWKCLACIAAYCTETYVLHASGRTSCGSTFGSVGERGSFGRYLRKPPAPWVTMGRCLVALLVLGWHCCPLQKSVASWKCLACIAAYCTVHRRMCCMLLGGRLVVLPLGPSVSVGLLDRTYASLRLLGWPWADVLLHC